VCQKPLRARQKVACSAAHRAQGWRQAQAEKRQHLEARDAELRRMLEAALTKLGKGAS